MHQNTKMKYSQNDLTVPRHCLQYFSPRTGRSPKLFVLLLLLFIVPFSITGKPDSKTQISFQWPLIKGKYPDLQGVTSTFGESRYDHFHNGLDISSSEDPVYGVAPGMILFSKERNDNPFAPVEGPGNYVILDHGKGYWSGYYHLHSLGKIRQGTVDTKTPVGLTGNTGHSTGSHLHFFITSQYGKIYNNPLDFLPSITDRYPPTIGNLLIITPQGTTSLSHTREEKIRLTRPYPILVEVIDPGLEKSLRRGAYTLEWKLNENRPESRSFGKILHTREGWLLDEKYEFSFVFKGQYYNLGELAFVDGENTLVLKATDFNGNKSQAVYRIRVQREY